MGERGIDGDPVEVTGPGVGAWPSTAVGQPHVSARRDRGRWRLVAIWSIASLAFLLFLAVGTVPAVLGRGAGEWVGVLDTWRGLGQDLPRVGHATLLRAVFYGAGALVVVGAIVGLWLAMVADSTEHDATTTDLSRE